jgi:voltage-gated potassium channel
MNRSKRRIFEVLEAATPGDRMGKIVGWLIMGLILANIVALVLESIEDFHDRYAEAFLWFEAISIIVFTTEYVLRLWSCVGSPRYAKPISGRLRYALTPLAVIDLIAILPFYIYIVSGFHGLDFRFARATRMLRLAKLGRYSSALQSLGRTLRSAREELAAAAGVMLLLLFFAAALMYYAERDAQPDRFSSIPAAAWWAAVTMTTVGYGDVVPVTVLGRLLGGLVAALGVCSFALPTAIIGARYLEEIQGQKASEPIENKTILCPHCGRDIHSHASEEAPSPAISEPIAP